MNSRKGVVVYWSRVRVGSRRVFGDQDRCSRSSCEYRQIADRQESVEDAAPKPACGICRCLWINLLCALLTAGGLIKRTAELADVARQAGRETRFQATVRHDPLFDVRKVAAFDDAVQTLRAAVQCTGLAADHHVGGKFPRRLGECAPVVHFDDTGAVAEQEFDHFLVDAARDAVAAHAPVTALAQIGGAHVLALGVEAPGPGLPIEVRAAVVRDDDLLTEGVVAVLVVSFTFAAPDTDEGGEKREEFGIDIRAEAQVCGVLRQRKVRQGRNVERRRRLGALDGDGDSFVPRCRASRHLQRRNRQRSRRTLNPEPDSRLVGDQAVHDVHGEPSDHDGCECEEYLEENDHGTS